jgi:hypothetical protein
MRDKMLWAVEMLTVSLTLKLKFSLELLIQYQMKRVRRTLWHIKHRKP